MAIGQALVDANYLECITVVDGIFRDAYTLYKHGEVSMEENVFH